MVQEIIVFLGIGLLEGKKTCISLFLKEKYTKRFVLAGIIIHLKLLITDIDQCVALNERL